LLEAGGDYFVCIQTYGGNVRTGQNGVSEEQTSFIFFDGPSGEDWYYTTTTSWGFRQHHGYDTATTSWGFHQHDGDDTATTSSMPLS
jgi:hypothetical protein